MLKNLLLFFVKIEKPYLLRNFLKLLPKNFKDFNGNNLFHYAALFQSETLFNFAINNKANINELNKNGNAPLHEYIKHSFVFINLENSTNTATNNENKFSNVLFKMNKNLLMYFFKNGADVNLKRLNKKRDGQWEKVEKKNFLNNFKQYFSRFSNKSFAGVLTNSRSNHMETPTETLIELFWIYWEHVNLIKGDNKNLEKDWDDSLLEYYEIYDLFSKENANINLLEDGGTFFDLKNESVNDAMQFTNKYIVSHFFAKYVCKSVDLQVVKPLLSDKNLQFDLLDEYNNNILHILFGRISSSFHRVSEKVVNDILFTILNNPSFKSEYLHMINSGQLTPLGCFKKDSKIFTDILNSHLLQEKLTNNLKNKISIKRKVNKV